VAGWTAGGLLSVPLSRHRTKRTVCTCPCNIYVSSHVTHVPSPGSACVSQDCASGRSGQSLDGSRAEHLSIPIPENAEHCPSQRLVRWRMSRGKRADGAFLVTVLRLALHTASPSRPTRGGTGDCRPTPADEIPIGLAAPRLVRESQERRTCGHVFADGAHRTFGTLFLHATLLRGTHST